MTQLLYDYDDALVADHSDLVMHTLYSCLDSMRVEATISLTGGAMSEASGIRTFAVGIELPATTSNESIENIRYQLANLLVDIALHLRYIINLTINIQE